MAQINLAPAEGNVFLPEIRVDTANPGNVQLPDFDELPDIIVDPQAQDHVPEPLRQLKYVEYISLATKHDIIVWNIQPERIEVNPNKDNTQNAVEEYFMRARRHGTDPDKFLNKYYRYSVPPRIGRRITRSQYNLYKSRIACDRDGVVIPRMDKNCQKMIYYCLLEAAKDLWRKRNDQPIEPRPPFVFDPVFNAEKNCYEIIK